MIELVITRWTDADKQPPAGFTPAGMVAAGHKSE